MKIAFTIARWLLGLIFLTFGLNAFFQFLHMPAPTGVAGQFLGAIVVSHYYVVIFFLQILGGLLLLFNRFIPLALVILGPILVNIFCFHLFMQPAGLPLAIVVVILWFVIFWRVRRVFAPLLASSSRHDSLP